jgi:hypothetical protein
VLFQSLYIYTNSYILSISSFCVWAAQTLPRYWFMGSGAKLRAGINGNQVVSCTGPSV